AAHGARSRGDAWRVSPWSWDLHPAGGLERVVAERADERRDRREGGPDMDADVVLADGAGAGVAERAGLDDIVLVDAFDVDVRIDLEARNQAVLGRDGGGRLRARPHRLGPRAQGA